MGQEEKLVLRGFGEAAEILCTPASRVWSASRTKGGDCVKKVLAGERTSRRFQERRWGRVRLRVELLQLGVDLRVGGVTKLTAGEHSCCAAEVARPSERGCALFFRWGERGAFSHFPEFAGKKRFPFPGLEHHQVQVNLMVELLAASRENKHHAWKQQKCFPRIPRVLEDAGEKLGHDARVQRNLGLWHVANRHRATEDCVPRDAVQGVHGPGLDVGAEGSRLEKVPSVLPLLHPASMSLATSTQ